MKLIVALGNVGSQYAKTRHNAGFMAADRLIARLGLADAPMRSRFHAAVVEAHIRGHKSLIIKPTTLMNRSGMSVAEAVSFFKVDPSSDLLVLVDDLALGCGTIRLRASGGAGGHNGLSDIKRALGGDTYPRCRIGIDPKPSFMDQADYVLGRFTDEQAGQLEPALDRTADAIETFIADGIEAAMNRHNAGDKPADQQQKRERPDPSAA